MILTTILLGLVFGSFLNVLVYRLPRNLSLWKRSFCPHCRHTLAWYDLIPLISYVCLKGRCRHCSDKISLRYPLNEAILAAGFYLGVMKSSMTFDLIINIIVLFTGLAIILIDLEHLRIPDVLVVLLLTAGIVGMVGAADTVQSKVMGMTAGFLLLTCAGALGYLLPSGQFGFGIGDIKLAMVLGLLSGLQDILIVLAVSVFVGAGIGICGILLGRLNARDKIPFGSIMMAVALVLTLLPELSFGRSWKIL